MRIYKNDGYYEYLGLCRDTATNDDMVTFKELFGKKETLVCKKADFFDRFDPVLNPDTKERMQIYLAYKGVKQNDFEKACGLAHGTVSHMSIGVNTTTMRKISKAFPDINLGWLVGIESNMIR